MLDVSLKTIQSDGHGEASFCEYLLSSVFNENQYLSAGKEKVRLHYVP